MLIMDPAKRIIVNTVVQYSKSVINTLLSLYTVRLVLLALGQSDYGIFNLIAGVIAMIGFITNALVTTTQRHLSYYQGMGDNTKIRKMFANSFLLHLAVGFLLSIVLLCLMDFLCMEYLNIVPERRETARLVYGLSVGILFITLMSAPFKALFIAHENIVYISVIEVLDGILKLVLVVTLLDLSYDRLMIYAWIMVFVIVFQFLAFAIYGVWKYEECKPSCFLHDYSTAYIKEISGFATWTTLGMGAVVFRQQGLAVLINKFFGTVYNASYGIANQIYGALSFIVTSIINAMNPQIMQAEGKNNRQLMLHLAEQESKFIVSIMALLFIPLTFEMENILQLWLGNVPPYATFFSQCIFIIFLIDQTTYGLHTACQAIGNIRTYTLLMYTPKLLALVVFWILLKTTHSLEYVMYSYMAIEALVAIMRLPYLKHIAGINIRHYLVHVFLRFVPLLIVLIVLSAIQVHLWDSLYRPFVSIPVTVATGLLVMWGTTLTASERSMILKFTKKQ